MAQVAGTGGTGRPYPTGADYSEALRDTATCFEHPLLARGLVAMGPLRMPRVVSGNYGSVFRVTAVGGTSGGTGLGGTGVGATGVGGTGVGGSGGREYAVKCFTRAVPDRLRRYRAIADALREARGDWRVDVEFVPRGVSVDGRWYPVVLMEWVHGSGLVAWLEDHLGDRAAIDSLADQFAGTVTDLERHGLAHGDLQHGNIVVGRDGRLRLIDYDGMYVPALADLGPAESGHRNYQHPARGTGDFGPGLDRFSAHVIHLTLRVLAREPWLWQTFHEDGGEHLLLKAEDLAAPTSSERFTVVSGACPELAAEFARLAYWASRPPPEVGALGEPVTVTATGGSRRSVRGLPTWLAEAARPVRETEPAAAPAAGSGTGPAQEPTSGPAAAPAIGPATEDVAEAAPEDAADEPTPRATTGGSQAHGSKAQGTETREEPAYATPIPHATHPSRFSSLSRRTRWTARAALAAVSVLAVTAIVCTLPPLVSGTWLLAGGVAALVLAAALGAAVASAAHGRLRRAYLATPEIRRRIDADAEHRHADEHLTDALRRLTEHDEALRAAERAAAEHATARFAASKTLRARYDDECEGIGRRLADALASIDRRRESLEASGPREEAQALRDLHDRALRDGLADHPLPAHLLGSRVVAQLGREGILTAADFVRVTSAVPTSPHLRAQATVSRPGRTVRVDGMSPALARRLQEWRDEIVEELRLHLPAVLPYQEAQDLHRRRADRRIDLARQAARFRARALAELRDLEREFEATERDRRRSDDREAARLDAVLGAAELTRKQAQYAYDQALHRVAVARDAVGALSVLTYRRFLRDALFGP